jgi:antitoxin component YwqK of YwqJK toxin-antitoxin module
MAPVTRNLWEKGKMINAVRGGPSGDVGGGGQKRVAYKLTVPNGNVERYARDSTRSSKEVVQINPGKTPILSDRIESELVKYCIEVDSIYGLRRNDAKCIALQLAIRNSHLSKKINLKNGCRNSSSGIYPTDGEIISRYVLDSVKSTRKSHK